MTSISVASVDAGTWHHRLKHMCEKGIKAMLPKGKPSGLKSINLDFCEECVYEKQRKISFLKEKKSPKIEMKVHLEGMNRCGANLKTNDAEIKLLQ